MDNVSPEKRTAIMRAVKSKNSLIEVKFRKSLWEKGIRYRKNLNNFYGKPDIIIRKKKVVIFVDSCFWHGCKEHVRIPSSRTEYWSDKINRNIIRDKRVNQYYCSSDWRVIRVWEHDLKNKFDETIKSTLDILNSL